MPLPITRLASADLDACLDLAIARGWHPDPRKWAMLLDLAEVYGIRDPAGGLIGTTALTRYGRELAAVSMMLVAPEHGRRGFGGRLMTYVLERTRGATVFLYATPYGRPLYERLGFRSVGEVSTAVGRFTGGPAGGSRHAEPGDGGAILELDAAAVGADRGRVIGAYLRLAEQVRVVEHDGSLRGYAVAAGTAAADQVIVGPVVAHDIDTARTLIADVASATDAPVRLDLDHRLRDWATERGIESGEDAALMVHGDRELPGARERVVLPMTLALG